MSTGHSVEFQPSGRGKAKCAANPDYPEGVAVDISNGASATCAIDLPYPAPECGTYIVKCHLCRLAVALTAAGRPDDPTRLVMPCNLSIANCQPN